MSSILEEGNDASSGVAAGALSVLSPATVAATAEIAQLSPAASIAISSIPTRTTLPDEIVRHDISDEELDVLSEGTKSTARDILLMFVGAFIGATPGFCKTWDEVFSADVREPMTYERLAGLTIPLMAATAIVVTGVLLFRNRKTGVAGLVARIRTRTQSRRL